MDYNDPAFGPWLDEAEAEAKRVKLMNDYRERQATDLLLNINRARIVVSRVSAGKAAPSEIDPLIATIKELRGKLSR